MGNGDADETEKATLTRLRATRGNYKGAITKIERWLQEKDESRDAFDVESKLEMVDFYHKQFEAVQTEIEVLSKGDVLEREDFDERVAKARASLKRLRFTLSQSLTHGQDRDSPSTSHGPQVQVVHAPSLPVPRIKPFDGENYLEYPSFMSSFKALFMSSETKGVPEVQRFVILKDSLSGVAFDAIQHLQVTKQNYNEALKILDKRFMKKRLIFESIVRELYEVPSVDDGKTLRKFLDLVSANLKALECLDATQEQIGFGIFIHHMLSKLDQSTMVKWEEKSYAKSEAFPNWTELLEFLEERASMQESIAFLKPKKPKPEKKSSYYAGTSKCGCCGGGCEALDQCATYLKRQPKERFSLVKEKRHCFRCLCKLPHNARCPGTRCDKCHGTGHHSTLHLGNFNKNSGQQSPSTPPATQFTSQAAENNEAQQQINTQQSSQALLLSNAKQEKQASSAYNTTCSGTLDKLQILGTAVVLFQSTSGTWFPARVLIDSGSMTHFVVKRFASKLKVKQKKTSAPVIALFGDSEIRSVTTIKMKSRCTNYQAELEMLILPELNHLHPSQQFDVNKKIPKNIPLADPNYATPQRVDAIIGVELAYKMLMVGQIQVTDNLILQKTLLGWILAGEVNVMKSDPNKLTFLTGTGGTNKDDDLEKSLQRFWELDTVPNQSVKWSPTERICEEHFRTHMTRDDDGRFVVRLPFIKSPSVLGDSYNAARVRLTGVSRRLNADADLKRMYDEFLDEYESMGHMEQVSNPSNDLVYFPHHGVYRPGSSSTKLRVVFDASAPSSSGVALNDITPHGPTIQPPLFNILIDFRYQQVALCGDIPKMYRQVRVHEDDQKFQCILWYRKGNPAPVTFKLKTVTYGTSSAPFLAIRSLNELAQTETEYPRGSKALLFQTYVDNTFTGGRDATEALACYREIIDLLAKGQMEMRKWCSNSPEVMQSIPLEHHESLNRIGESDVMKTLGLLWNPATDHFVFSVEEPVTDTKWTKRKIISYISKIFDPLGLVGPVVVRYKIFIQQLWAKSINWDESLPIVVATSWSKAVKELPLLSDVKIPRYVFHDESQLAEIQLHCFADASSDAFGTVFYVRCKLNNGDIRVFNLCSRSRVAPLRKVTLPRLELCGAFLLTELLDVIRPTFQGRLKTIYCWLDAMVALTWIENSPHRYSDFIANRVTTIQERTKGCIWQHVPGKLNPADTLSRGATPAAFIKDTQWLSGPSFLYKPGDDWTFPKPEPLQDDDERLEHRKETICLYSTTEVDLVQNYRFHGSLDRIQKTFAYMARWLDWRLRKITPPEDKTLTPSDLERGLKLAVRIVQAQHLHADYSALKSEREVPKKSRIRNLRPFLDEAGVMRVGGRLDNAPDLSFEERHPMILPKSHPLTSTIFYYYHWKGLHLGPTALLAAIRRKFWPLGGRPIANRTYRNCIPCTIHAPQPFEQLMADLPTPRVEPFDRCFEVCGIDLYGPFTIKQFGRGSPRITVNVASIICFRTRAIQFQYVMGESTDSIINMLIRFTARAGRPLEIWSDNAPYFHGANGVMKAIDFEKVDEWCRTQRRLQWKFIPARSPHHGGLWESSVKLAKTHLKKVLKNQVLHMDSFITLLSMVEAVLNSRPITPLSINPIDGLPLTPAHFLVGGPIITLPDPTLNQRWGPRQNLVKSWLHLTELKQHWLGKFQTEVRQSWQQRAKWVTSSPNVRLGKLVLMVDKDRSPYAWTSARITKLFPGRDGRVRAVEVTAAPLPGAPDQPRVFTRAITQLAPIPEDNDIC